MNRLLLEVVLCFLETLVLVYYAGSFYEKKYKDIKTIVIVFFAYLLQLIGVALGWPYMTSAIFFFVNIIYLLL